MKSRAQRALELLICVNVFRRMGDRFNAERHERKLTELDEQWGYVRTSRGNDPPLQHGEHQKSMCQGEYRKL